VLDLRHLLPRDPGVFRRPVDDLPCEGVLVAGPSDVLLSSGSFDATVESLDAFSAGASGLIAIPAGETPAAFAPGG